MTASTREGASTTSSPAIGAGAGKAGNQVATKNRQRIGYRRIVQLLVYLVIIPTVVLLGIGIGIMFVGQRIHLVLGIMTVAFVAVVGTGVVLVIVFVRREANLSELQADFVSKVSHELKTPLTAIRLLAETLERTRGNPAMQKTQEQCLSTMLHETERLAGRIDRLLDWGRMEAGRKLYDLREETVADIVMDSVAGFVPLRAAPDLDFAEEIGPDLPAVMVDRHAMVDAVVNLLSNAQKYGGSPPQIRLRAYATAAGEACIEVQDNGGGIARSEHRRIFEKFYRIDDRLSRSREGSGLGLAIVKHVVRAHRGRITVESAKRSAGDDRIGSIFRIVLPGFVRRRGTRMETELAGAAPTEKA